MEFVDVEVGPSSSNQRKNNIDQSPMDQDWADLQPTQPYRHVKTLSLDDNDTDAGGTYNTLEKLYAAESDEQMSYGYSLNDGVASKHPSINYSSSQSGRGSASATTDSVGRKSVDISLGSPGTASVYSGLTNDDGSMKKNDEYSNIAPVTNKTKSNDFSSAASTQNQQRVASKYERVCIAPPGRLGVVIDTTKDGPVVYQVKDDSPMLGQIFPGDRMMTIDDIDTRGLRASQITQIMAEKADSQRSMKLSGKKIIRGF